MFLIMNSPNPQRIQHSLERLEHRIAPAGLVFTATKGIVNVFVDNDLNGTYEALTDTFAPFAGYQGAVNIATGDFDGDGNTELVTATATIPALVKIWNLTGGGHIGALQDTITPSLGGAKGASVTTGDLNSDGRDELLIGSGPGVASIVLTAADTDRDGLFSDETMDNLAPFAPAFKGGVKLAAGNTNNAGGEEVIVAMGRGGGTIAVFSDVNANFLLSDDAAGKLEEFTPFGILYTKGVNVAAGVLEGAGGNGAEIIAAKRSGKPRVLILTDSNASGTVSDDAVFDTITPPGFDGTNVAAGDTDGSGTFVEVLTARAKGTASTVTIFDDAGDAGSLLSDNPPDDEFQAFVKPAAGVTLAFGKVSTEVYSLAGAPRALADSATTILSFTVAPGAGLIRDLDVGLALAHTHNPDLDITLTHNGVSVLLFTDIPGSGTSADGFIIRLDDNAGGDIGAVAGVSGAALTGTFNLEGAALLSAFEGLDASGEWRLTITDDTGGDTGTLFDWSLFVRT